jgi:hypothetical protein
MAGLGYKSFTAGSVLTAAQVQGYLQDQSIMTFASVSARNTALTAPTEGMVCYIQDNSSMFAYDGTNWSMIRVVNEYVSSATYSPSTPAGNTLINIYAASGSSLNLAASTTYEVEGILRFQHTIGASAIQPSFALTYSGSTTSSQIAINSTWNVAGFSTPTPSATGYAPSVAVSTSAIIGPSSSGANTYYTTVQFKGHVRTNTGGTLVPQISFSSNTSLTAISSAANSYWTAIPIGSNTVTSVGTFV